MTRTLDRIADEAATALQRAVRASDPGEHRAALREAAERIVDARALFTAPDGGTDWRGRSYDYRLWSGAVYGRAGVPASESNRLQASVRYHVSNVLRERLDDATLDSLGLRTVSARDRSASQRAARSRIIAAVTGSGLAERDVLMALGAADGLLKRLEPADLAGLPAEGRKAARDLLGAVSRHSERLAAGLTGRRKG